ncbi:hypothetical protein SLEP1_g47257 [Rubroshorea leprosula]|uniref:RNase H type-1 domain-containing protein n=1 Tax=Rubroshorea leprosula TaxID=152421 RepID=A0AAV5LPY3_9ROSI|nr:hypothetical protein SLEP1_g47257 [Rubroshorea leprosula]
MGGKSGFEGTLGYHQVPSLSHNRLLLTGVWKEDDVQQSFCAEDSESTASLGVILQDSNGSVLGAGKKTMSFQGEVTHAEVLAICFGVQLGKEFSCKNIIVESDSMNVVCKWQLL